MSEPISLGHRRAHDFRAALRVRLFERQNQRESTPGSFSALSAGLSPRVWLGSCRSSRRGRWAPFVFCVCWVFQGPNHLRMARPVHGNLPLSFSVPLLRRSAHCGRMVGNCRSRKLVQLQNQQDTVIINLVPQHDPQSDPELACYRHARFPQTFLNQFAAIETLQLRIAGYRDPHGR